MGFLTKEQKREIRRRARETYRYDFAVVVHPHYYEMLKEDVKKAQKELNKDAT